ncbi:MAG: type II secretion system protein [Clostridia bacterium]|nr:type II secretion system protein [Clostridia bacterium]
MKNTNKKGFTIVELVIVIAVIAILAAVLIPTFVGLVNKANQAADQQVAKNMNVALANYSAENGAPETFEEVLLAVEEAGYVLANLNAKANGSFYAWDKANNQIVYIDAEGKVIYQNANFNQADLQFVVANGDVTLPTWANKDTVVDMTKHTGATFLKEALVAGGNVTIGGNIVVTDEGAKSANVITTNTSINFGNNVINLDLPNATGTTANWIGLKIEGGDVVLDGTDGGVMTADNDELYAVALYNTYAEGSNVTIKGGKYISGCHAVYIKMPKSIVTIEGGYFEQQCSDGNGKYYVLNVFDAYGNSCKDENVRSKFIVKGGTFVNFNPEESICGVGEVVVAEGYKVVSEEKDGKTLYTVVAE